MASIAPVSGAQQLPEGMNANRAAKAEEIAIVRERFSRAVASVLIDPRGINVAMITDLRSRFREQGVEYRVVKNTLLVRALEETGFTSTKDLERYLPGMTGVAWSYEDPSVAAKIVKTFRAENENQGKLGVKCGLLENTVLAGDRVESDLATLPGKNEMRGMLLATLQAPAQSLVRQLQAAGQNFAYLLDARKRQLEAQ